MPAGHDAWGGGHDEVIVVRLVLCQSHADDNDAPECARSAGADDGIEPAYSAEADVLPLNPSACASRRRVSVPSGPAGGGEARRASDIGTNDLMRRVWSSGRHGDVRMAPQWCHGGVAAGVHGNDPGSDHSGRMPAVLALMVALLAARLSSGIATPAELFSRLRTAASSPSPRCRRQGAYCRRAWSARRISKSCSRRSTRRLRMLVRLIPPVGSPLIIPPRSSRLVRHQRGAAARGDTGAWCAAPVEARDHPSPGRRRWSAPAQPDHRQFATSGVNEHVLIRSDRPAGGGARRLGGAGPAVTAPAARAVAAGTALD